MAREGYVVDEICKRCRGLNEGKGEAEGDVADILSARQGDLGRRRRRWRGMNFGFTSVCWVGGGSEWTTVTQSGKWEMEWKTEDGRGKSREVVYRGRGRYKDIITQPA